MALEAKILTVSDSVAHGHATDRSGIALISLLREAGFAIVDTRVCEDGVAPVSTALLELTESFCGLVVTTGGTGFGLRDLTPEGTRAVLEREAPGLSEAMRSVNPLGRLSRAIAGVRTRALIVNTPGSPSGATECLSAIIDVIPHALTLLAGENPHPHAPKTTH
jgi:molybdenum cofactor synthesis domain-containing protein